MEAALGEPRAAGVAVVDEDREQPGVGVPGGGDAADVPAVAGREERKEADRAVLGGVGRAASADDKLSKAKDRWSGGGGFRYLIARQLGFQTGIDVARGPEEWAFYLQFGSAWVLF